MLEGQLAFAHISEASFIDQRIADGPGMAGIELLIAGADIGSESRNIRAGCLEIVEGLKIRVIGEVIIKAETLPLINMMVEAEGELILGIGADWHSLIGHSIRTIGRRHEAQHIDCDRILTISGDYVRRKHR